METGALSLESDDGSALEEGTDYAYSNGVVTIMSEKPMTLSMAHGQTPEAASTDRVETHVEADGDGDGALTAHLTIENVNISPSSGSALHAVAGGLDLKVEGDNVLEGVGGGAGIENGVDSPLSITGTGSVEARGSRGGMASASAAIGCGASSDCGDISISGNVTVEAYSGKAAAIGAAGVGGSIGHTTGSITVSGNARVLAVGGSGVGGSNACGAGIGAGGWGGTCEKVVISGNAFVDAYNAKSYRGIGGGTTPVEILGGFVKVSMIGDPDIDPNGVVRIAGGKFHQDCNGIPFVSSDDRGSVYGITAAEGFGVFGCAEEDPAYPWKVLRIEDQSLGLVDESIETPYDGAPLSSSDVVSFALRGQTDAREDVVLSWSSLAGNGETKPLESAPQAIGSYQLEATLPAAEANGMYYPQVVKTAQVDIVAPTERPSITLDRTDGLYTYGDDIVVSVSVPMDERADLSPTLYSGGTALGSVDGSPRIEEDRVIFSVRYPSSAKELAVGSWDDLVVRFSGDETLTGAFGEVSVPALQLEKAVLSPSLSGDASKPFDGKIDVPENATLSLSLSGVKNEDPVSATCSPFKFATSNAGEKTVVCSDIAIAPTTFDAWYRLSATEIEFEVASGIEKAARVDAPQGLTGIAPLWKGAANGSINGVETGMEWRVVETDPSGDGEAGKEWKAVSENEASPGSIIGLEAGTYEIRWAEDDSYKASPAANVEVPEAPDPEAEFTMTSDSQITYGDGGSFAIDVEVAHTSDKGAFYEVVDENGAIVVHGSVANGKNTVSMEVDSKILPVGAHQLTLSLYFDQDSLSARAPFATSDPMNVEVLPRPVEALGVSAVSRAYEAGNCLVAIDSSSASISGVLPADESGVFLETSETGSMANDSVGMGKPVEVAASLTGSGAKWYDLAPVQTTVDISKLPRMEAPLGLVGISPSNENTRDGKIKGVMQGMEWRIAPVGPTAAARSTATGWQTVTAAQASSGEIGNLAAGTYEVRWAEDATNEASPAVSVRVEAFSAPPVSENPQIPNSPENPENPDNPLPSEKEEVSSNATPEAPEANDEELTSLISTGDRVAQYCILVLGGVSALAIATMLHVFRKSRRA
ncbi:hypothetical protein B5F40_06330 [Gordonibacter sp. An230]|uniref:hypothetical protein n=1 Tax=Gordonibacter sp. An230 TaxID=1965592 RepID=UPI000B371A92|nr:hypothetical protein [Gordonibacter sp. An230]OUO90571.1 hypothetical protein B5F40_06330 [Gordonibacter sp. An230]